MSYAEAAAFFVSLSEPRPPSVNAMYSDGATRRFLTKEGASFKDALRTEVVHATQKLDWKHAVDEVYLRSGWVELEIRVYLESVYNGSWKPGSRTKTGNLRSPYQKVDAGSYDKIIQDAIVLGTGIDDSAHLVYTVRKLEDKKNPRIEVNYVVVCGNRTDNSTG